MKKYILTLIAILWALLIFYASSKDSATSNTHSKYVVFLIVEKGVKITNKMSITNITSDQEINMLVNKLNKPLRKVAHFAIYFVLGIILYYTFISFGLPKKSIFIVFALCFIYSLTDEYHQTLIFGRTGRFLDCIIDTLGAMCGCLLGLIVYKLYKKYNISKLKEL